MSEQPEKIRIEPKKTDGRGGELNVSVGKSLHAGIRFRDVNRAEVSVVRKGKERAVPKGMVVKKFRSSYEAERVQEIYRLCKEAGLRVMPAYRIDTQKKTAVMTNLNTEKQVALSANNPSAETLSAPLHAISNFDDFLDELCEHSVSAARHDIYLNNDCYFFLVREDSKGEYVLDFIVGDYERIRLTYPTTADDLKWLNLKEVWKAVSVFLHQYMEHNTLSEEYLISLKERCFPEGKDEPWMD